LGAVQYTYTYGDNESLLEAKSLCYSMAIRNAIESFRVYVLATSEVQNYHLKNDLIQMISSGYLEDTKIIEEDVVGQKVHYIIEAYLCPSKIERIIKQKIAKINNDYEVIDSNRYLKIVGVTERNSEIKVTYKVLEEWGGDYEETMKAFRSGINTYKRELDKVEDIGKKYRIMIDYFDEDGNPVGGDYRDLSENSYVKDQAGTVKFVKSKEVKSYRAWLPH